MHCWGIGFLSYWTKKQDDETEKTVIRYFHNGNHTCDPFSEWYRSFITTICWICRSFFVDKYSDQHHKRFVLLFIFHSHHQCICICTFPNNQIFRQRNLTILLIVKWHTQIYEYGGISDQQSIMIIIFIIIITWYNKRNVCFVDRISSSRTKHISNSFIYRSFLCSKVGSKHAKQIGYIQIFSLLILYYYHDGHFFVELMSYVIKKMIYSY